MNSFRDKNTRGIKYLYIRIVKLNKDIYWKKLFIFSYELYYANIQTIQANASKLEVY